MRKIFTLLLVLCSLFSFSQSTTLVISQFYGAGGNTGASLNADYVELHNVSTSAQSLSGLSIQYSSATNTGLWTGVSPLPAVSIPAGGYYLIQMGAAGANGAALPTPDYFANPTIALSGTSGKLALVNGTTALTGCPIPASNVIDAVGYGTANCYEGPAATAVLAVTTAGFRNNNGCTDTDNNGSDFTVQTAAPRNSATAAVICSGGPANPSITAGTVVDFGNVVVGTNSTSQSFNISGANLTGFPDNITITAPSTDFQVSNNNSTWGASTTVAFTSATLASTPVYVRFTPQSVGPKSGNVSIIGGGVTVAVTVAVSGNGITAAGPAVTFSPASLTGFGPVCLNTTAGPNSFTINGTNLTAADLVVGPLAGYTFSSNSGGPFTASLNITHPAGAYTGDVFVSFTPTAVQSYDGSLNVSGGGLTTAATINVTGSGISGAPTVSSGSPSAITQNSATLSGTISSQGCSPVTAYGFEYSTTSGFTPGTGTQASSSNLSGTGFTAGIAGLQPGTTYYYIAYATNAGGTTYGIQMSFNTSAPPPATLSATALSAFGAACVGTSVGPNSFVLSGTNLNATDITVGPLNGFTFSTSGSGNFTNSLTITHPVGTYSTTVYVQFTPPAIGSYNGNIQVSGAGVSSYTVPVSASANNTAPSVLTGDATIIDHSEVTASGSISDIGCSPVTEYGIEYSGINGFVDGSGTRVPSTNLSGTAFSSQLTGLIQNTTYYYKAYAKNSGGIAYGLQNSFTTSSIGDGLIIYSTPIIRGQSLHFSVNNLKAGHYSVRIHNVVGQLVYQKDFIVQVNFMDYHFTIPGNLPIGLYNLQVINSEYKAQKAFMVQ
ncbi:MAG: choice-of-anchor D domain-containing protein [Bacteroidetes bacterium]|nr:choice-of-anchor D domain-containing protein [Bacteroidota bacterium]